MGITSGALLQSTTCAQPPLANQLHSLHTASRARLADGGCISATKNGQRGVVMGGFRRARILLLIALVPLGGCLSRSRPVAVDTSLAQLQTATCDDLIERINAQATEIQTLKATVEITASVGGSKLGKITQYQEIRGYILARKPSSLRMIGLVPILQNPMFDRVRGAAESKVCVHTTHK